MVTTLKRHPTIPHSRVALSERRHAEQIQRGLYTTLRGENLAIPFDRLTEPTVYLNRKLWRQDGQGRVFRPGTKWGPPQTDFHKNTLTWVRDNLDDRLERAAAKLGIEWKPTIGQEVPHWWYMLVLGHDLHVSTWGDLYARHWHIGWANPFNPEVMAPPLDPTFETCPWLKNPAALGFVEDRGWLSGGKVTDAFVSEEIDELVSATSSEYADFDFHEVGTDNTAENNDHTALQATSGIARATGTPTDSDPVYQNVGTVTADATETWEEHGLFNNSSGAAMMDRSLTNGQSVVSSDQVQYTYQLTKNAEA